MLRYGTGRHKGRLYCVVSHGIWRGNSHGIHGIHGSPPPFPELWFAPPPTGFGTRENGGGETLVPGWEGFPWIPWVPWLYINLIHALHLFS